MDTVFFCIVCVMVWWHTSGYLNMFIVTVAGLMISKFLRQSIGFIMLSLFV
jgi:hypothetical protein